jgi:hypothetical protein
MHNLVIAVEVDSVLPANPAAPPAPLPIAYPAAVASDAAQVRETVVAL